MKVFSQFRKTIKANSKKNIKKHWAGCISAPAIFTCIIALACYAPLFTFLIASTMRSSVASAGQMPDFTNTGAKILGAIFASYILILFLAFPLATGLINLYISVARGEYEGLGALLRPYGCWHKIGKSIRIALCILLRIVLWQFISLFAQILLLYLIYGDIDLLIHYLLTYGALPHQWAWTLLSYVFSFLVGIKVMSYGGAWVLLHDDENLGAWQATKLSARRFKGMYFNLLTFHLSYFPWHLLTILSLLTPSALAMLLLTLDSFFMVFFSIILFIIALIAVFALSGFTYSYELTTFYQMFDALGTSFPVSANSSEDTADLKYGL